MTSRRSNPGMSPDLLAALVQRDIDGVVEHLADQLAMPDDDPPSAGGRRVSRTSLREAS